MLSLEEMGIPVEYSHHEVANGQHEIDLPPYRRTDDGGCSDDVSPGGEGSGDGSPVYATFMPKPFEHQNGSGMHINMSLFQGGENAFYDPEAEYKLSATGRHFIAGLLRHAGEIACVCNQWVNSYKRLSPGYEAPVYATWAAVNRSNLVRVPHTAPARRPRSASSSACPTRHATPTLRSQRSSPRGSPGCVTPTRWKGPRRWTWMRSQRRSARSSAYAVCPAACTRHSKRREGSAVLREALGEHTFNSLLENKRIEWDGYRFAVTDYEMKRYLPIL